MIVAIDTATPAVSVALADATGLVASFSLLRGRRHVETLMPVVEQLLNHAGCGYPEVTAIAVDIGPGLFTGLRVGVATAKALALALDLPVYATTSLEILVAEYAAVRASSGVGEVRTSDVLAVIDARRKELYAQRFRVDGEQVEPASEPVCVSPTVAASMAGAQDIVVGDVAVGNDAFGDRTTIAGYPVASRLALLAPTLPALHPDELELLYLRAPDAEINWTSRP